MHSPRFAWGMGVNGHTMGGHIYLSYMFQDVINYNESEQALWDKKRKQDQGEDSEDSKQKRQYFAEIFDEFNNGSSSSQNITDRKYVELSSSNDSISKALYLNSIPAINWGNGVGYRLSRM